MILEMIILTLLDEYRKLRGYVTSHGIFDLIDFKAVLKNFEYDQIYRKKIQ